MSARLGVALYLGAIVAANLAISRWGPGAAVWVAFVFVGADLTLRDAIDEAWGGRVAPMVALIAAGGALSWALDAGAGRIALASTLAFVAAASCDWAIYRALRGRPRLARMNGSNIAGATVDSLLFVPLAFGVILPETMALQLVAKVAGGLVWSVVVVGAVSVRRDPAR